MGRTFLYCRVSTQEQTTQNQVQEVKGKGFDVREDRITEETISGKVPAMERALFARMLDRMEAGDTLVVTKLDRLGRDVVDVTTTIEKLQARQIKVHCMALGEMDLTSSTGRLQLNVLAAVAQFERDLLIERTQAGLARAKAEGKTLGRARGYAPALAEEIRREYATGSTSIRKLATKHGLSAPQVQRILEK